MKFDTWFQRRWRSASVVVAFVATALVVSDYAVSHINGMTGVTRRPGDTPGCTCHCANPSSNTSVTLSTASSLTVQAGQTISFTITVDNSNESKGGCDIAVWRGTLTAGNDGLQNISGQLTHTQPKALAATWSFTYTAPSTAGGDTIYANGNAVNNDAANGNGDCSDNWNFATSVVINVVAPTRTIALSSGAISFGARRVGGNYTDNSLTLTAGGDQASVTINSTALNNGAKFTTASSSGTNGQRTINTGSSETETIAFSPTDRGAFSDSLIITSNVNSPTAADARKAVYISGTGVQAVFSGQTSILFNNVKKSQSKQIVYSFSNTGDDTMFVTNSTISNGSGTFSIVSPPNPSTIPPGASSNLTVQFTPPGKSQYTGTLSMTASNGVAISNIALSGTGIAPQLTIPTTTDIGLSRVGRSLNGSVTFSNDGDDTLHVASIILGSTHQESKFNLSANAPGNLLAKDSRTLIVSYTPTSERADTAEVTLSSDDPNTASKKILIVARGGLPKMVTQQVADTIDIGNVRIGSSGNTAPITISNTGTYELTITSIQLSSPQFQSSIPPAIQPKQASQIAFVFHPTAEGPATAMAIISSDDPNNSADTLYLKATGTNSQFDVPNAIAFGDLRIGKTRDTSIWLRNLGTAAVKIKKYTFADASGGFKILDTATHSIDSKDSAKVTIRFTAASEKQFAATLTIVSDEAASPSHAIAISGRGIDSKLVLNPEQLEFGTLDSGAISDKLLIITNSGNAPATIGSFSISGATAFVLDDSRTSITIAPSKSDTIHVSFHPVTDGSLDGTLTLTPTEGSPLQVPLHGIGHIVADTTGSGSVRILREFIASCEIIPNPAHEKAALIIEARKTISNVTISFYNAAGKLLLVDNIGELTTGSSRVALSLPKMSGIAIVRISSGNTIIGQTQIVITR